MRRDPLPNPAGIITVTALLAGLQGLALAQEEPTPPEPLPRPDPQPMTFFLTSNGLIRSPTYR